MARASSLSYDDVESDIDPFAPARTFHESMSAVEPLYPTGKRIIHPANPGAEAIFSQHARINAAFAEFPEPEIQPYPPALRLAIVLGGAVMTWGALFWGARALLKA